MKEALRCAERRTAAFDLARCVLVHGDPYPWNALQVLVPRRGAEAGFVFVDPYGFLADPAYDVIPELDGPEPLKVESMRGFGAVSAPQEGALRQER